MPTPMRWSDTASVYQIYVRSFADANGDGIGDLDGITERLDYVQSLGVDAIWLNPCFPSPQRDHGYDVADYFGIEPNYGDLAAFDRLIAGAHSRNIRVLLDIVPNHCSSDHAMFQTAVAAGPGSPQRDLFWFRPGKGHDGAEPPNNWQAIFGGSAWTRIIESDGKPGEWYLGVFTPHQPDWNFYHESVAQHFDDVLRFWFDRGVDGFRADAIIYLGKEEGLPDATPEEAASPLNPKYTYVEFQHTIWRRWRTLVNEYEAACGRDLLMVAEAFTPNRPDLLMRFANPTEFHQAFAFDLMLSPWRADRLREIITATVDAHRSVGLLPTWTLNNHDTQRTATRYGRTDVVEAGGFHEGQFRSSTAPVDPELGQRRARAAALLELALPGSVYLYSGEELGLPEVLDLPDAARQDPVFLQSNGNNLGRDGCRVPMPWSTEGDRSYGFSSVGAADAWLPQPHDWGGWSVQRQTDDASSVLTMYRSAGRLRPSFAEGDFSWIEDTPDSVLAFRRGETLIVCNPSPYDVQMSDDVFGGLEILLSSVGVSVNSNGNSTVVPANATMWMR